MTDLTELFKRDAPWNNEATGELFNLVYEELRKMATAKMKHEPLDHTMQATALVHEAFLALVDQKDPQVWENRRHFFAAAAESMRRILIDSARRKLSLKRGGSLRRVDLDEFVADDSGIGEELIAVNDSLEVLGEVDAQAAELVKLRVFAGLSISEAGELLGISRSAAYENWKFARAWLAAHM
jgi:RNA polymerase sigma factor (TIGR02999 family)